MSAQLFCVPQHGRRRCRPRASGVSAAKRVSVRGLSEAGRNGPRAWRRQRWAPRGPHGNTPTPRLGAGVCARAAGVRRHPGGAPPRAPCWPALPAPAQRTEHQPRARRPTCARRAMPSACFGRRAVGGERRRRRRPGPKRAADLTERRTAPDRHGATQGHGAGMRPLRAGRPPGASPWVHRGPGTGDGRCLVGAGRGDGARGRGHEAGRAGRVGTAPRRQRALAPEPAWLPVPSGNERGRGSAHPFRSRRQAPFVSPRMRAGRPPGSAPSRTPRSLSSPAQRGQRAPPAPPAPAGSVPPPSAPQARLPARGLRPARNPLAGAPLGWAARAAPPRGLPNHRPARRHDRVPLPPPTHTAHPPPRRGGAERGAAYPGAHT